MNDTSLGIFAIQESHMLKAGSIKFQNSSNYQIYEKIRSLKSGGGLVLGVLNDLNPVWIRDGEDRVEAMTIQISVQNQSISIINAYGPQEYDNYDKKMLFWKYLDDEVFNCQKRGTGCMIVMDSNAWLGSDIIKKDPHSQNKNGL